VIGNGPSDRIAQYSAWGGERIGRLADWIMAKAPSAVVLPEWRNNTPGQYVRKGLTECGLQSVATAGETAKNNGILLAALDFVESKTITPPGATTGELMMIELKQGIHLLGCYFPQRQAKVPFFQQCIQMAKGTDVPFVMMGDINTGRNDLDIEGTGAGFHCADLFGALNSEAGLVDLWREQHGDRQEWTWRSSVNGFRIDHVFGNKAFIDRFPTFRCAIDHTPRLSGLTDHSAAILEAD
jgi:exonuclease III